MDTKTASPIRVRGLTKRYGDKQVLDGFDLDLAPGETYALLGPNGAGKSTAIETFEGLRRPDAGEVRVLGENPLDARRAWKARLGIVAQQTGDLGPYTSRELVSHFGSLYPNPRETSEVLDLAGLSEHADKRATKLSGGQQRRLDVALGIVGRPELLFLDEPTTGFDPEARHRFWDMLRGLTGEGTAILLTTHYLDEAANLADRVGVLSGGRIVAEAPPGELGGETARTPIVRWIDAAGVPHEERTDRPGALVARLCAGEEPARGAEAPAGADPAGSPNRAAAAASEHREPLGLEIRRPSLEDIYLELIGHDADGDPAHDSEDEGAER